MAGSAGASVGPRNGGLSARLAAPPSRSWANVASGSSAPLPAVKKMTLKFVPPGEMEGQPRVTTAAEIAVEGAKRWASTLLGCFVGGALPFSAMNSIARKIWSFDGLLDVLTLEKGFYLFRFASDDGLSKVVERGPWLFAGRFLVLQRWHPGLPVFKANLHRIPVWAKFHNVPIELWSEEGLSHIASAVGIPLYADAATEACSRVSFARICVEVDASRPLVEEFEVEVFQADGSSSLVTIGVSFQWKPPVCEVCKVFGHPLLIANLLF